KFRLRARLYTPLAAVYIAAQAERALVQARQQTTARTGEIHETRLRAANHDLQPQPRRRAQRFADVGRGPAAVRAREEIHLRNRRSDVGRVLSARRKQKGSLELYR